MKKMKIGSLELKSLMGLAPMASLTDIAFRRALDETGGPGFMVTELISAEGLKRRQEKTVDMIRLFPFKVPQFIQLFGNNAESISEAAKIVENETDYSGVDINMGCPVRKVVSKGAGAALMNQPDIVKKICRKVRKTIDLPLTAKIRLGSKQKNFSEIMKIISGEGFDAVAVHFRFHSDGYRTPARWEYVKDIPENLKIPVLGNGDIEKRETALERLEHVDGLLIGRSAIRNPFIFREIVGEKTGDEERKIFFERIIELIKEHYPDNLRLPRLKAFTKYLVAGSVGARKIRAAIYSSHSFEECSKLFLSLNL